MRPDCLTVQRKRGVVIDALEPQIDCGGVLRTRWSGKIRSVSPVHLIFSIWATTQHYSDFSAQVEAVTGKTLADKEFFNTTLANLELLLVDSILTS